MTFEDIVNDVAARVGLTGQPVALARIGLHVNRHYRRLTASIGLNVFRRVSVSFALTASTREQTITGIERIVSIFGPVDTHPQDPLDELSYNEMLELIPTEDDPRAWAPKRMGASYVTFLLDSSVPNGGTLTIEGEENASTLSGSQEPAFSESYHDIILLEALADEQRKAEKIVAARDAQAEADELKTELRLSIAVGAYKDIVQGKGRTRTRPRINPSTSVPSN